MLSNIPLQKKLTLVILAACVSVLLIFVIPFFIYQWINFSDSREENLITIADYIARDSKMIEFGDQYRGHLREELKNLESQAYVGFAGIFLADQAGKPDAKLYASYLRSGKPSKISDWQTLKPGDRIRQGRKFVYATGIYKPAASPLPKLVIVVKTTAQLDDIEYDCMLAASKIDDPNSSAATQAAIDELKKKPEISFVGAVIPGATNFLHISKNSTGPPNLDEWNFLQPGDFSEGAEYNIFMQGVQPKDLTQEKDTTLLGILFLEADISSFLDSFMETTVFIFIMLFTAFIVAFLLANMFQRIFTKPIYELADTASRVSTRRDYSLRAEKKNHDEIGSLIDVFNEMLSEIQKRDSDIRDASNQLEEQVDILQHEIRERQLGQKRESELHKKLERAQRMESLGILAGGVAHDLNNILGPLVGYPEMILEDLEADSPIREDIEEIQNSASRAAAVIQDLLTLSRRGNYNIQPINLNEVAESYIQSKNCKSNLEKHADIRLIKSYRSDTATIEASAPHIEKVIMNLFTNACEAMPEGGEIKISVKQEVLSSDYDGFEKIPPGTYEVLEIADMGVGIDPEDIERIFEPFYSIKPMGDSGSGLGLAVVYGVIKDLKGFIDIKSTKAVGSTFKLFFPSSTKALTPKIPPPSKKLEGNEQIILVDDVREQGRMAESMLTRLGYAVTVFDTGRKAIEYVKNNHVDLAVLDMIIEKDFDGLDTYKELLSVKPDIKAIVCTGFSQNERILEAKKLGVVHCIRKPYTIQKLGQAIRDTLDNSQPQLPTQT